MDPTWDETTEVKPNEPGNLAYQGAKMLLGDKPSPPEFSQQGGGIQEIASPVDFVPYEELGATAAKGAKSIGQTIAELGPKYLADETGALQLAASNGQLTKEGHKISNSSEDNPLNSIKARFGSKKMDKYIDKVQSPSNGPYVYDLKKSPIPIANYSSEPTGVIGNPGIGEPHGKNLDPLAWYDMKHGATKKLIEEHAVSGKPLVINTSSDLVGHADYIDKMPKDTVVNMHLIPEDPKISSGAFGPMRELLPGNPSRSRQLAAIDALKEAGIKVNVIEPKSEDLLKYFGPEKILEKTGMSPEEFKLKVFPREKFQLIKNYADGGEVGNGDNRSPASLDEPKWDDTSPVSMKESAPPSWEETEPTEKYTTPGQTALFAAEKLGKGFAGPIATGAEALLTKAGVPGLSPQEQESREAVHPTAGPVLETAGLVAGDLTGVGELGLLAKAAGKATEAAKLGKVASGALRGAIEMAGLSAGDETSALINHPEDASSMSLAHVGLNTALGAIGGGLFSKLSPKWLAETSPEIEQHIQDFKNEVSGIGANPTETIAKDESVFSRLTKQKPNAKEIYNVGVKNGWPVLEGMLSGSREVQMAEDALLKGPPTIASIARREEYQKAYDVADKAIDAATSSGTNASETETGNALKDSLLNKLNSQYSPIKDLYAEIEPYKQAIPLSDKSTGSLSRTISNIIEEQGLVPGSERYNFVKTFADGIEGVDNMQKLANFRTEVSRSAGPLTKDLAQAISEKLNGVEDRAIKRFSETMMTGPAKTKIISVIEKADMAKSQYAKFRTMLQDLGNSLGKKKIYGPQNFMDFIEGLNPQTLARRAFNENNTEFASYLAKNFPEEMGILRDYERKAIRDASTNNGILSSSKITKKISEMEPEMRKIMYHPEEQKILSDAKIYLDSMPPSFNPSGTAHESAFRSFFEHPTGAAIANLRDFGIQSLIKAFGKAVPGAEKKADLLIPILGPKLIEAETNPRAFKSAVEMAIGAINAAKAMSIGVTNLFTNEAIHQDVDKKKIHDLDKKLDHFSSNPQDMIKMGGEIAHYAPDHSQAVAKTMMNAVNYLNSQRPKTIQLSPLDEKIRPTQEQITNYGRTLSIAENPLHILPHIKSGTLLPQDVKTLTIVYPAYYNKMSQQIINKMTDHVSKEQEVPYRLRQSLSMFLGHALDSTMTPGSIQAVQASYLPKGMPQQPQGQSKPKKNTSKLGKISESLQTPGQKAESMRSSSG